MLYCHQNPKFQAYDKAEPDFWAATWWGVATKEEIADIVVARSDMPYRSGRPAYQTEEWGDRELERVENEIRELQKKRIEKIYSGIEDLPYRRK